MAGVPGFVAQRIRRQPPPGAQVVPGSTPVISFGDFRKARVATLGWNPSKNEFLDRAGRELDGNARRLETHTSIGRSLLQNPRGDAADVVWNGCKNYFRRKPYHWFNKLERVLNRCGASYKDGTACHLDLVQWSTDPVWRNLAPHVQEVLLRADVSFLRQQLAKSSIRVLLLNGRGIVSAVQERLGINLESLGKPRGSRVEYFAGRGPRGLRILGWSINLQSSMGVTNQEIRQIGDRLQQQVRTRQRPV